MTGKWQGFGYERLLLNLLKPIYISSMFLVLLHCYNCPQINNDRTNVSYEGCRNCSEMFFQSIKKEIRSAE